MRVPFSRALFDLAHLNGLSDALSLVLIVSERTLYLLQNLVTLDTADHVRYAIERYGEGEYLPVVETNIPEWALFSDVADRAAQEIIEVGSMPISFISDASSESHSQTANAANMTKLFSTVPAGEVWEIEAWWLLASTAITMMQVIVGGAQNTYLENFVSPVANLEKVGGRRVSLGPGALLALVWNGCTPNVTVISGGYNYRVLPLG